MLSSSTSGFAVVMPLPDRLRVVVLDAAAGVRLTPGVVDGLLDRCVRGTAATGADAVMARGARRPMCASAVVADLWPDGGFVLETRAAPPALLLSPGRKARLLSEATPADTPAALAAGEVLMLVSASFLEDPPPVLGTVRRATPDGAGLADLRRALRAAARTGATASLRRPRAAAQDGGSDLVASIGARPLAQVAG
jgi:hypothetical protein